jgi:hypothetical protein
MPRSVSKRGTAELWATHWATHWAKPVATASEYPAETTAQDGCRLQFCK